MRKLIGLLGLSAVALLSACGGGGGSPGTTTQQYHITLTADSINLPLNVSDNAPTGVVNNPYMTTLYVNVDAGNDPVNGASVGCNIAGGLTSGALYYFDGDTSHQTTVTDPTTGATSTIESAYRSITLTTNSGGASFHYGASSVAGTTTITCSVTGASDNKVYSASIDIKVGAATGLPASIQAIEQAPGYLGVQGNLANLRSSINIQTYVWDDANQPVPDPAAPNLQVSIIGGTAASGAYLLSGARTGTSIPVSTVGGVASIALASGGQSGSILLELRADRADNNVANGIQSAVPVFLYHRVDVFDSVDQAPLAVDTSTLTMSATQGLYFAGAVGATGGVPPYRWDAGALENGLSISSDGVISGTPQSAGTYVERVRVTDQLNNAASGFVTITVAATTPTPPLTITTTSIAGTVGIPLSYALPVPGGATPPLTWIVGTLPAGLTFDATTDIISGTPTTAGTYTVALRVTDSKGITGSANLTITISAAPSP